jgi:hypothetical protein
VLIIDGMMLGTVEDVANLKFSDEGDMSIVRCDDGCDSEGEFLFSFCTKVFGIPMFNVAGISFGSWV